MNSIENDHYDYFSTLNNEWDYDNPFGFNTEPFYEDQFSSSNTSPPAEETNICFDQDPMDLYLCDPEDTADIFGESNSFLSEEKVEQKEYIQEVVPPTPNIRENSGLNNFVHTVYPFYNQVTSNPFPDPLIHYQIAHNYTPYPMMIYANGHHDNVNLTPTTAMTEKEEEIGSILPSNFKLPASKAPIIDSLCVCAINKWGIEVNYHKKGTPYQNAEVIFQVTDFENYYTSSRQICSKQHPTDDIGARVKSLRRWFINFPKKKERRNTPSFQLVVKPEFSNKVSETLERLEKMLCVQKRAKVN